MEREFIQEQNDLREDYKIKLEKPPLVEFLRGRQTRGTIVVFLFAIVVPIVIYYFLFDKSTFPPPITDTCVVDNTYKIPCGRTKDVNIDYCDSIHCCFDNSTQRCFHYLPSRYFYSLQDGVYQRSLNTTPFGRDQELTVKVTINELSNDTVQVILHESSVSITTNNTSSHLNYGYNLTENLYVDVFRKNNQLLLTTAKGPTIISNNYWEWSFQLTDKFLFGLGQTLIDLDENSTLTKVIYGNNEEHNVLPSFIAYDNGKYHGLIVRHSGPLEVTVLPSKLVLLKSIVGVQIMLELAVGPTLKEVLAQQNTLRSSETVIDLTTLGVHVCREGVATTLTDILSEVDIAANTFQYDSDCLHENLFLARVNEEDPDTIQQMEALIGSLTEMGRNFVLSLPPHVPTTSPLYEATSNLDVFFKNKTTIYQGKFQDLDVVYPYFKHPEIDAFLQELVKQTELFASPSYLVLSRNWPSDESFTMEEVASFQYLSEEFISAMSSTLPWNVTISNQSQFIDHDDYGASHFTQIKAKKPEALIMTASHTFDTAAPIVIQNVNISWTNFRKAIVTTLFNSISGFPLTSVPVCGSTNTFSPSFESLCIRWYLMASTAPLFRISSDEPYRDPISLANFSQYAANVAEEAINFRYSLLYYFYGVLSGEEPLMRPMFYDFPNDEDTFGLVDQYMVGPDLLVAHPTLPGQTQLKVYFPKSGSTWLSFNGGLPYVGNSTNKGWVTLWIVETEWIGFIREGAIIPLVEKTTLEDPTAPPVPVNLITLKVALKCDGTGNCTSTGTLKIDTSNFVNFSANESELTIENSGATEDFYLDRVEIFRADGDAVFLQAPESTRIVDITSCSYPSDPLTCM